MKKYLFIVVVPFLITSFTPLQKEVFICSSAGAKKYHYSKNCRGLSPCKHEIKNILKSDAQNKGLTLCGWED